MITSVNNLKIINYSKLKDKKYRDKEKMFIVEGTHLVEEAIKENLVIEIFSLDGSIGTKVNEQVMKKLSSLTSIPNVVAICKKMSEREISDIILILDDIQDPGNLGTIIRSCVAFNINTIISSPNTVDIYNPKVVRSSEGMLFKINYLKRDIVEFIKSLKDYKILVTDVEKGKNIKDINDLNKVAIVMGNEGSGVSTYIKELADDFVNIKMEDKCESLNVGVSTSILLYEMYNKEY